MKIDPGLLVVIIAVLIFYLRLIVLQRQKAKQVQREQSRKGSAKSKTPPKYESRPAALLSTNPTDLLIAGCGTIAVIIGALLYAGIMQMPAIQPYWWIFASAGIIAFSWGFKP